MARIALLLTFLLLALPAHAEWTSAQRSEWLGYCTPSCEETNANDPVKSKCGAICSCIAVEAGKFMTPADYARVDAATRAGRGDPMLDRVQALGPVCVRKATQ